MPGELEAIEGSTAPIGGSPPVAPAAPPVAGTSAAAALTPPKVKSKDEDDGEGSVKPDDKGIIRMPFKSFMSRVHKQARSELKAKLKAIHGTEDEEVIAKKMRDYDKHLVDQDEKRRKDLTETARLTEDAKVAKVAQERAEKRAEKVHDKYQVRKIDQIVSKSAERHIQSKYVPAAVALLKEAKLRATRKGEEFTTKHLHGWFSRYAQKNPELSTKTAGTVEEPKKKSSLSNGVGPDGSKPPKPVVTEGAGLVNGKTARPGQPNSMNKTELRAYQRSQGLNGT